MLPSHENRNEYPKPMNIESARVYVLDCARKWGRELIEFHRALEAFLEADRTEEAQHLTEPERERADAEAQHLLEETKMIRHQAEEEERRLSASVYNAQLELEHAARWLVQLEQAAPAQQEGRDRSLQERRQLLDEE
jgi:hypothetical protein